jgi:hypothetical protein
LDDDILSNITASTDACTDGSYSLAYLVRTGLGSALHYVGAAAGRCYLAQASAADPKSRKQALSIDREGWLAAEKKELDNHKANGSWTPISRSSVEANRKLCAPHLGLQGEAQRRTQSAPLCARLCANSRC